MSFPANTLRICVFPAFVTTCTRRLFFKARRRDDNHFEKWFMHSSLTTVQLSCIVSNCMTHENSKKLLEIERDFENRLLVLENDLKESQDELLRTKEELTKTKLQLVSPSSSKVRESSFMSVCGFQPLSWRSLGTILFESISSEYNNPGNMLDLSTGMFTVDTAGM